MKKVMFIFGLLSLSVMGSENGVFATSNNSDETAMLGAIAIGAISASSSAALAAATAAPIVLAAAATESASKATFSPTGTTYRASESTSRKVGTMFGLNEKTAHEINAQTDDL